MLYADRILLIAWGLVLVAGLGMLTGLVQPPSRFASRWLTGYCAAGMVGFLMIKGALPLAFFTGVGAWVGAMLTVRRSERLHFRAGALGWMAGLAVGAWWMMAVFGG